MKYVVDRAASKVEVIASATLHGGMSTTFSHLEGTLEADPERLAETARAQVKLMMAEFSSDDRMRDWKLKKDLEADKYPEAVFTLEQVSQVEKVGGELRGVVVGSIAYRGKSARIEAPAHGTLGPTEARAEAKFSLDLRSIGVTPPKLLFLKVKDIVEVRVTLIGRVG